MDTTNPSPFHWRDYISLHPSLGFYRDEFERVLDRIALTEEGQERIRAAHDLYKRERQMGSNTSASFLHAQPHIRYRRTPDEKGMIVFLARNPQDSAREWVDLGAASVAWPSDGLAYFDFDQINRLHVLTAEGERDFTLTESVLWELYNLGNPNNTAKAIDGYETERQEDTMLYVVQAPGASERQRIDIFTSFLYEAQARIFKDPANFENLDEKGRASAIFEMFNKVANEPEQRQRAFAHASVNPALVTLRPLSLATIEEGQKEEYIRPPAALRNEFDAYAFVSRFASEEFGLAPREHFTSIRLGDKPHGVPIARFTCAPDEPVQSVDLAGLFTWNSPITPMAPRSDIACRLSRN